MDGNYIRVEFNEKDSYTITEQRLFPKVSILDNRYRDIFISSQAYDYDKSSRKYLDAGQYSAFERLINKPRIQTIARALSVGDKLTMVWQRNNSSPTIDDAGLVKDDLVLDASNDSFTNTWLIGSLMGLDNSARMVKLT